MEEYKRKINQESGDQFTQDEINNLINIKNTIAERTYIATLCANLEEKDAPAWIVRNVRDIGKLAESQAIEVDYDAADLADFKLCFATTICERDYLPSVMIPEDRYTQVVHNHYALLRRLLLAYHDSFVIQHADLAAQVAEVLGCEKLTLSICEERGSLYFLVDASKRCGIYPYHTYKGVPMVKK